MLHTVFTETIASVCLDGHVYTVAEPHGAQSVPRNLERTWSVKRELKFRSH